MRLRHLFGIASILIAAWLAFGIWKSGRKLKGDNLSFVKPGMSLEEVESLLGGSPGRYGYSNGSLITGLGFNRPDRHSAAQVWQDKNLSICVRFDDDERVISFGVGLSMEIEDNWSFTYKILRRVTDPLGFW